VVFLFLGSLAMCLYCNLTHFPYYGFPFKHGFSLDLSHISCTLNANSHYNKVMTHVQKTVGAYTCNKVIELNFSWRTSDSHLFGVQKKKATR